MRKGQRKTLNKREKDFLEGPYEEAKMLRKALRRGKNLAFSKDTCLEKERVRSKVTLRKVEVELKRNREFNKGAWVGGELDGDPLRRRSLTFAPIEGKTPVLRSALQPNQTSLCSLYRSRDRGGGGANGQIVSINRAADGRRQRSREIIYERAKNGSLQNTSTASKGTTFVILINHASAPIRKERLSPTSNARREPCRNEFVVKSVVPDRVESFREINSRKNRPRTRPGFVKPIRNGLSKEQNLI